MKKFSAFVLLSAILATAFIFSCKSSAKQDEKTEIKVASISVKPTSLTLKKGETSTLKATILPSNAPQEVKWESDAPTKVSVDKNGVITAKDVGKANIKVTSLKDATKSATCVVTVSEAGVAIEKVEVNPSSVTLKKGETSTLTATITPSNASQEVKWESDTPDKVSVEEIENGKVKITAKDIGTANIKATSLKDGTKSATCVVTVDKAGVEIISIEVKPSSIKLKKGDTSTLEAIINPINAPQEVKWESDAPDKVSVDDKGKITAKAYGTAKIKATSLKDGTKSATCVAIVEAPVEKLKLDKTDLELGFGESYKLTATIEPAEAPQEVIWSCDVEGVATCSAEGLITAGSKEGRVNITATSKADPSKKRICTVYVAKNKIESLKLDKDEIEMEIDAEKSIDVHIQPENASYWMNYTIGEGSAVRVTNFYRRGLSLYTCNLKSGSVEKTQKITFWSIVKPSIRTTLTIKTYRPKMKTITVANKEIKFTDKNEKMVATVLPAKALKDVKWESENIEVAAIDSSSGRIVPVKPGKATIVATATDGSGVKGKATLTVKAPEIGVGLKGSPIYYGSKPATLTIEPKVGGLVYDFDVINNNPDDLEVYKKDSGNDRVFEIKVKNQRAKTGSVYLKVMSKAFPDATTEVGVGVKTIIPKSISIEADDKMYLSEELPLSISAPKEENSPWYPEPNKDVRWEWDNSYSTSGIGASDFEIKQEGKVRLRNPSTNHVGKTFRIKAISQLDSSIVATKVITIYPNIAKIVKFNEKPFNCNEWTICDDEDEVRYNGFKYDQLACLVAGQLESLDNIYNKFVVTEKSNPTDIPKADHFRETVYTAEKLENATVPNAVMIRMSKVAGSSSSQFVKFYVWPIDPKTEKPVIAGSNNSFDFRIWAEPKGIEFEQGDFEIGKYKDDDQLGKGWRNKKELNEGDVWKYFKVRVVPSDANPYLLAFTTKKGKEENSNSYALHDCITEVKQLSAPDENGWRSVEFHMRDRAGWVKNRTDVCFCLSLNPAFYTNDAKIKAYMHVIQDSSW